MGKKKVIGQCALCKNEDELRLSHIMPKLFFRSLKKTAVTKHMRESSEPNIRVQDGMKEYLLCGKCEEVFGKLETRFSNHVFQPLIRDEANFSLEYETEWIRRFYISVAWRYLFVSYRDKTLFGFSEDELKKVEMKLEHWRKYLNLEIDTCKDVVRLFPLTQKYISEKIYPKVLNAYYTRTIELLNEISVSGHWAYTYIKTPYLLGVVDFIQIKEPEITGTEIYHEGRLFADKIHFPELIAYSLNRNFNRILEAIKKYSNEQLKLIFMTASRNWDEFERSETWKAMSRDGFTKEMLEEMMQAYK